jgi:predicted metalloprotease
MWIARPGYPSCVDLNKDAQIDTGQIEDRRGQGGGGLSGVPIPLPGGRGGRGGWIVTILFLIVALAGGGLLGGNMLSDDGGSGDLGQKCAASNPNRLDEPDCRSALFVNSIQDYWQDNLPQTLGAQYQQAKTVFFSQAVNTGCGQADSAVGPFYCPADGKVYIDLTFFDELETRFGAKGVFAQAYVLAHEYGHHVQNLVGTSDEVDRARQRDPGNANALSVRLELQADCYAGVWSKHATQTTDASGRPLINSLSDADIKSALNAAAAVGDDTIQKKTTGRVDESKFTHGTAAQRQKWFTTGYGGDPKACDTFTGAI